MSADKLAKGIYWDRSWNPFTGCSPVGAGCDNCWAKRAAEGRLRGRCGYPVDEPFRPTFHPERLDRVNSRQKPQVIALCFMSDPFHEAHDLDAIYCMLDKILICSQHTFIALTKRPKNMRDILQSYLANFRGGDPIPNLVGGVSIWDQPSADRMIPIVLETNLATRIVSLEPCLEMVEIASYGGIDGVILGGESGPRARPMHPDRVRSIRHRCNLAGVPFFFKQWGKHQPSMPMYWYGKKAASRLLDGRTWDELPEVMR